jgi:hypothetical protein
MALLKMRNDLVLDCLCSKCDRNITVHGAGVEFGVAGRHTARCGGKKEKKEKERKERKEIK